ncbi:class I SAM-dependent methyltransferase [SAR86 cluster bacterium]|nr:class I SAM-dependent methyltransferase [SAR86 cluster bacterium]
MKKTKDPVNQNLVDLEEEIGTQKLGLMNNSVWYEDPKRLIFTLSRYKFVSKMLSGKKDVAEIGCGDGFGSRIVQQEVQNLTISDYDELFIDDFKANAKKGWPTNAISHDILKGPFNDRFDAIYSLDVLEHIPHELENIFLKNSCSSLNENGILIIGMPSIESQQYASAASKDGHINCKSGDELKKAMSDYFKHVLIFSMNDEVVHTGFSKMAHYLFAIGISQI